MDKLTEEEKNEIKRLRDEVAQLKENLRRTLEEAFNKDRDAILNRRPAIYRL